MTVTDTLYNIFNINYKNSVSSKKELKSLQNELSTSRNIEKFGLSPLVFIITTTIALFTFGVLSKIMGVDSRFNNIVFISVSTIDTFLFLSLLIYGEERFVSVVIDMQESFEMNSDKYYEFFGNMVEAVHIPSPFSSYTYSDWPFVLNRTIFVLLFLISSYGIVLNSNTQFHSLSILGLSLYVLYHFLLSLLGTSAMLAALWGGAAFVVFMTLKISDMSVRLDITRSNENLGLEPYGIFILQVTFVMFLGIVVTGWTFFLDTNIFSAILTIVGSISLPAFFVGSQYGIHKSIQNSKSTRLKRIQENYDKDIRYWFSEDDISIEQNEDIKQLRANTLINMKREIESLPEWPTKTKNFIQVGIGAIISNLPLIVNSVL